MNQMTAIMTNLKKLIDALCWVTLMVMFTSCNYHKWYYYDIDKKVVKESWCKDISVKAEYRNSRHVLMLDLIMSKECKCVNDMEVLLKYESGETCRPLLYEATCHMSEVNAENRGYSKPQFVFLPADAKQVVHGDELMAYRVIFDCEDDTQDIVVSIEMSVVLNNGTPAKIKKEVKFVSRHYHTSGWL